MASLNHLPDLVLLKILWFLPLLDRYRVTRVCRRWKWILNDLSLRRRAKLPIPKVRPKFPWHLVHRYCGTTVQSVHLWVNDVMDFNFLGTTPEVFKALLRKWPHQQHLRGHTGMFDIPVASVFGRLRRLEIHNCDIFLEWMLHNEYQGMLPFLEQLVLDHVPSFQDCHLQRLSCLRELRSLVLAGTYFLSEEGLDRGLQKLGRLQRIEVLGCNFSADSALQAISRHLREVQHIRLTVEGLSGLGLAALEGTPTLESLSLLATADTREVRALTTQLLSSCLTLPRLRVLELQGQGWEGHEAEAMLKEGLPHCEVIIGAALPQTMDWWKFVSNPKNFNNFPQKSLSSTNVGVTNPCFLPRIFDTSSQASGPLHTYSKRRRMDNHQDAFRFPPDMILQAAPPVAPEPAPGRPAAHLNGHPVWDPIWDGDEQLWYLAEPGGI